MLPLIVFKHSDETCETYCIKENATHRCVVSLGFPV